jgi:hypothetical protein
MSLKLLAKMQSKVFLGVDMHGPSKQVSLPATSHTAKVQS